MHVECLDQHVAQVYIIGYVSTFVCKQQNTRFALILSDGTDWHVDCR